VPVATVPPPGSPVTATTGSLAAAAHGEAPWSPLGVEAAPTSPAPPAVVPGSSAMDFDWAPSPTPPTFEAAPFADRPAPESSASLPGVLDFAGSSERGGADDASPDALDGSSHGVGFGGAEPSTEAAPSSSAAAPAFLGAADWLQATSPTKSPEEGLISLDSPVRADFFGEAAATAAPPSSEHPLAADLFNLLDFSSPPRRAEEAPAAAFALDAGDDLLFLSPPRGAAAAEFTGSPAEALEDLLDLRAPAPAGAAPET